MPPGNRKSRPNRWREQGVAAVEFALISPLLIMLIVGILEFSNAWYVKATVEGAAREGAREYALTSNFNDAQQVTINAGMQVGLIDTEVEITPEEGCTSGADVVVTVTHVHHYVTGMFGATIPITGRATVRCYG